MDTVYTFNNKAHYTNASATTTLGTSFVLTTALAGDGESQAEVTVVRGPKGQQAMIDWKHRTFNVDDQTVGIDDLRSVRRLVNDTAEERTTMDFQVYRSKIIGKSIPATITMMDSSLSEFEALVLWMAVVYSEVTQHPRASLTRNLGDNIARGINGTCESCHTFSNEPTN
ncbi:hypothetical protein C0992_002118 [Termitomyces sp. T32_za158]|nr:hypothetical protein C0992_002118 [Termitomyces sp. T32_za158]